MKQKNSFSGQIGFVFAAAGSAVGVGNLWRFPYLAAKDGGGLFLIIYLVLVLTVGFVLLTTDIAIGRKTGKSAIYAYESMRKKWKFLGVITFLVPVLIMTYYAVIGGWILRYIVIYLTSSGKQAVADNCFTSFISSPSSVWYGLIFMFLTALIVYNGVEKGIERVSKFIMPVLLIGSDRNHDWTFPSDHIGCNESVVLFIECIYGNYDYIWILCKERCRSEQSSIAD